jgi:hypothetical protein
MVIVSPLLASLAAYYNCRRKISIFALPQGQLSPYKIDSSKIDISL